MDKNKEDFNSMSKEIMLELQNRFKISEKDICREFSGGGYHIWIKSDLNTSLVRAYDFGQELKHILKNEFKILKSEVFPKQDFIEKFGSAVKLPLSLNRKYNNKCEILDGFDLSLQGTGFKIPDSIPSANLNLGIKEKTKMKKSSKVHQIKIIDEDFNYFFDRLMPCFKQIVENGSLTYNQEGDRGYKMNLYLLRELFYLGASDDIIHKCYTSHPNYRYEITQSNINSARKTYDQRYGGIFPCEKVEPLGYCDKNCFPSIFQCECGRRIGIDISYLEKPFTCKRCGKWIDFYDGLE